MKLDLPSPLAPQTIMLKYLFLTRVGAGLPEKSVASCISCFCKLSTSVTLRRRLFLAAV